MKFAERDYFLPLLPMRNAHRASARAFAIEKLKDCKKRLDDDEACNHGIRVSETLAHLGYDEDVVIAGLLHDIVEDTETTEREILDAFGEEITRIVMAVTHDSSLKGKAKKEDLLRKVKAGGAKAIAVKLSDNCDNTSTIEYFKLWKVADYLDFAVKVQAMGVEAFGADHALVQLHKQSLVLAKRKTSEFANQILQNCL